MQIENHKEEVPFAHYEERFRAMEPSEAAARTGVKWDGDEFYVNLIGREFTIYGRQEKRVENSILFTTEVVNGNLTYNLQIKVFDDGVAFRYELTGLKLGVLPEEHTSYIIPEGTTRWMQRWSDGYEGFFPCSTDAR